MDDVKGMDASEPEGGLEEDAFYLFFAQAIRLGFVELQSVDADVLEHKP